MPDQLWKLSPSQIQGSELSENIQPAMEIISEGNPGISIIRKCIRKYKNHFQMQYRHLYYQKIHDYNQPWKSFARVEFKHLHCQKMHQKAWKLFSGKIQIFPLLENAGLATKGMSE